MFTGVPCPCAVASRDRHVIFVDRHYVNTRGVADENNVAIAAAGAIPPLVTLQRSPSAGVQMAARVALHCLDVGGSRDVDGVCGSRDAFAALLRVRCMLVWHCLAGCCANEVPRPCAFTTFCCVLCHMR